MLFQVFQFLLFIVLYVLLRFLIIKKKSELRENVYKEKKKKVCQEKKVKRGSPLVNSPFYIKEHVLVSFCVQTPQSLQQLLSFAVSLFVALIKMASIPSPHTARLNSLLSSSSVNHNKPSNLSFLHASSNPSSIKLLHSVSPSISSSSTTVICNVLKTVESADISLSRDLHGVVSTSKPTILVSEKLGEAGLDLLKSFGNVDCSYDLSPQDLCAKISLCDALIVRSGTKVTRDVFEAAQGRLKVVGRAGVGIDNVDLQAATEFGCLVVNAPTANTIAAAEHGIALLTSMARNVAQSDASMKAGTSQNLLLSPISIDLETSSIVFCLHLQQNF